jgi:hypothetical protein
MDKDWKALHNNPPLNWREAWRTRQKVTRKDTEGSAIVWILKHRHEYEQDLKIGLHPKDGYVVYHE